MLRYAVTFFVIALLAGILGASGLVGSSMDIASILGVVGLVLFVLSFFTGRSHA